VTARFWRQLPDGLEIAVRVTPKGGRDAVEGVVLDSAGTPWLAVRVSTPPDQGKANQAVIKILAGQFNVRSSQLALVNGASARLKRLRISGTPDALVALAMKIEDKNDC
jgi:uncharacterized protein (TIGR00251 family)